LFKSNVKRPSLKLLVDFINITGELLLKGMTRCDLVRTSSDKLLFIMKIIIVF